MSCLIWLVKGWGTVAFHILSWCKPLLRFTACGFIPTQTISLQTLTYFCTNSEIAPIQIELFHIDIIEETLSS